MWRLKDISTCFIHFHKCVKYKSGAQNCHSSKPHSNISSTWKSEAQHKIEDCKQSTLATASISFQNFLKGPGWNTHNSVASLENVAARNSFFTTHQIFARGRGWKTHHSVASVTKHCSPQRHTATCSTILPTFSLSTRSKSSYMDRNRSMACEQHCNAQTHTGLFSGGRAAARPSPQPSTFQSLPFQVVELIYDPVQLSKHFLQKKPQLFRVTEEMPFNCACKQTMSWASNCNKM